MTIFSIADVKHNLLRSILSFIFGKQQSGFGNPGHDFPQITYQLEEENLHATIEAPLRKGLEKLISISRRGNGRNSFKS
jgi:hypothetical protein